MFLVEVDIPLDIFGVNNSCYTECFFVDGDLLKECKGVITSFLRTKKNSDLAEGIKKTGSAGYFHIRIQKIPRSVIVHLRNNIFFLKDLFEFKRRKWEYWL